MLCRWNRRLNFKNATYFRIGRSVDEHFRIPEKIEEGIGLEDRAAHYLAKHRAVADPIQIFQAFTSPTNPNKTTEISIVLSR